jgi:hypothetical protein
VDHSAEYDALLRKALDRATLGEAVGRHQPEANLRALLADACRVARADAVPAERVVVAIKSHWVARYEARYTDRTESRSALERLVTACIEAYFDEARSSKV